MPRADRVPFVPGGPLIAVRATLNEVHDAILIADSGAQRMVISRTVAERLELDLRRPLRF